MVPTLPFPRVTFAVDRGGTFTDIVAYITAEGGRTELRTYKLLSQCPEYDDAPSEGIKRMLTELVGAERAVDAATGQISTLHVDSIRMGTTIATNALLEGKGVPSALVVTKGFRDVLKIGTQARPDIFALNIKKKEPVSTVTIEAAERVRILPRQGSTPAGSAGDESSQSSVSLGPKVHTESGDTIEVIVPLDEHALREDLKQAFDQGIRSVAISLLHAHVFNQHEERVRAMAKEVGFTHCSVSSELMPMVKYVPRTTTASVDAYLTPLLTTYVGRFCAKFTDFSKTELLFMQSDGGLTHATSFYGFRAVLSGPAGGVVGVIRQALDEFQAPEPIVGFDMGGTSTDVCRCEGGKIEHIVEAEVAGVALQAPQLDIHTVAAGGGSILQWKNSMYQVGPESAGAIPGPACYGRGGPLTVTDANLLLGRIDTTHFPHVFGKSGTEPLCLEATTTLFNEITAVINGGTGKNISIEEVAIGFVTVANEAMSRPIRSLTEAKGHRPSDHILAVFGGAGGQHGCAVAEKLGIKRVFVSQHASVLSALGIALAEIVEDRQTSTNIFVDPTSVSGGTHDPVLDKTMSQLEKEAKEVLEQRGFTDAQKITIHRFANMRFDGSNTALMVPVDTDTDTSLTQQGQGQDPTCCCSLAEMVRRFREAYHQQFGFVLKADRGVRIDDCRVRAAGTAVSTNPAAPETSSDDDGAELSPTKYPFATQPALIRNARVYFEETGWCEQTPVVSGTELKTTIVGPALVLLKGSTVVVEPNAKAHITKLGNVVLETTARPQHLSVELDPLPLSVFAHRFMSIAEQMGVALQRTALSTNIKERLDFSCGLFDADGSLVANAPHIPVHLGAMGRAIAFQKELLGADWKEGDVVVTNDPSVGGSHLPDITVITPCYHSGRPIFYIASRGHHVDIGGSTPGSMPPFSRRIEEEGAIIRSLKLVENGVFQEEKITELLMKPGETPGLSGCRALIDVISDLKAQVAANKRGVELVQQLIATHGLDVVEAYMKHIQQTAESTVRTVLKGLASKYGTELSMTDHMDDGTPITTTITIDPAQGTAVFDWTQSGAQVLASTNCPLAVVRSAIIYSLRCLIGQDIPLNEGAMRPITVITRPSSILQPQPHLPVVGGNVLTSQRITDVILMATHALACSQGDMNNFIFGNARFAYYETIAGGSGAGDGFHGASAVQTHMTNTRITDPEILELRYPLLLLQFAIREGSGGNGKWRGGDGVVRQMLFLSPVTAVILSERRALAPKGLAGGGEGTRGVNMLYRHSAPVHHDLWALEESSGVNLGGKCTVPVEAFDTIVIQTPGGGGWGSAPAV